MKTLQSIFFLVLTGPLHQMARCDESERVVYKTEIDANVARVWTAFTTYDGLQDWIAPKVDIDFRVGGKIRYNYMPDGELGDKATIVNTILAYDPHRMLTLKTTAFPEGFPWVEVAKDTWSVFYFKELDDSRTEISVVGLGYTEDPSSQQMRSFFGTANKQVLDKLNEKLSSSTKETTPKTINGLPLVFEEDFEDGHERWEVTDADAWSLTSEGDNHVFGLNKRISDYQPEHRSPHNIALIKDLELKDFVVTYRVRSTKDTGNHRDCCTFFCHQDASNFYYVHMGAVPDPHSGQIMIVDDAPRVALTKNERNVAWDDQWHTIKLERNSESGSIKIYFDDMENPHMDVTDKTFEKGRIGIGSFDDMNDFDDIRVYGK